jgi:NAD+ kinase
MARKSLKLIVLTGSDRPEVRSAWQSLLPYLKQTNGIEVVGEYPRSKDIEDTVDADMVVVLGGDGSILRGCRQLGQQQIPIVGINLGRLGFLADLTLEEFHQLLPQLQRREFEIGKYLMFECTHRLADGTSYVDLGLNEVTVTSSTALRMVDISLDIDDHPVTTFSCDGLIISTPIGSTAHNLSAGGPILRQDLEAFCITPICPHTLTVRPIVDTADRTYSLSVGESRAGAMVVIDGQINRPFHSGDRITIRRADATFKKVHFPGHSYYSTLHRKLGWRGQLDYRERIGQQTDTENDTA